jgi:regulator of protease activity HflC (stomatin/prohibitin superfamily)
MSDEGQGSASDDGPRSSRRPTPPKPAAVKAAEREKLKSPPGFEAPPSPVGAVLSDPRSGPTIVPARTRLWHSFWAKVTELLVFLGLARKKNPDGSYERRNWRHLGFTTIGVVVIIFLWTSVHVVAPGNVAVPVTFGHEGKPIGAGIHVTWPLTVTYNMSTRTQAYTMTSLKNEGPKKSTAAAVTVLGADGGAAQVDATVLYRVNPKRAGEIYREVGRDYTTKIVRPSARNCIRTEFTRYDMVQGATTSWQPLAGQIENCMRAKLQSIGVLLQDFQLREVTLSSQLANAVNLKVAAQQKVQQALFDYQTSQRQADITRVVAKATSDAQQIVACGGQVVSVPQRNGQTVQAIQPNPSNSCAPPPLTQETLQYLYIQAIQGIINSGSSSTVLLPFNQNISPLITVPGGQVQNPSTSGSTSGSTSTTSPSSGR